MVLVLSIFENTQIWEVFQSCASAGTELWLTYFVYVFVCLFVRERGIV